MALIYLDGGTPTLADGLSISVCRLGPIFGYAAIASSIGVVLRFLDSRSDFFSSIASYMTGEAWDTVSSMAVPVMVACGGSPIAAIEDSVGLLKKTWGETLIGNHEISVTLGLLMHIIVSTGVALALWAFAKSSVRLSLDIAALAALVTIVVGVFQAALSSVYSAVLYRYATNGEVPSGFGSHMLKAAFIQREAG
jgi:hypothetical protein